MLFESNASSQDLSLVTGDVEIHFLIFKGRGAK